MQNEIERHGAAATSINEEINEFVQRNRKPIFVIIGLLLLSLVLFIVALSVTDVLRGKAISAVEDFNSRYEALRPDISEDYSAVDVEELLADIESFAGKTFYGYAGGKAYSIAGNIHSDRNEWQESEIAWAAAAKAAKKTYLAPLAYFNAGAAAEEQGKTEEAIGYYASSLVYAADFPAAPRAQFAIGRLRESQGDNAAAIEAYRAVISGWTYDRVWASFAHSRIIALEME
jgi:tetratricopeptide (TPR) repeat protein